MARTTLLPVSATHTETLVEPSEICTDVGAFSSAELAGPPSPDAGGFARVGGRPGEGAARSATHSPAYPETPEELLTVDITPAEDTKRTAWLTVSAIQTLPVPPLHTPEGWFSRPCVARPSTGRPVDPFPATSKTAPLRRRR